MSKFALLSVALLLSACNVTWEGQGSGMSKEDRERGLKDVKTLNRQYENETYYRGVRQNMDGRANALARDMDSIRSTVDRHFFNYSPNDPYTNGGYSTSAATQLGRAVIMPFSSLGAFLPR